MKRVGRHIITISIPVYDSNVPFQMTHCKYGYEGNEDVKTKCDNVNTDTCLTKKRKVD